MCTVIYLPTKTGFILTSNRDESPTRGIALAPKKYHEKELEIVKPKDPSAGGTWVGYNSHGDFMVVLNGAFERHIYTGDYRMSRGLIVSELLTKKNPLVFWNEINLMNIEPFTLILVSENKLHQLVWDGFEKYDIQKSNQTAHIWSSATLYKKEIQIKRKDLFSEWLEDTEEFSIDAVHDFLYSYKDSMNGFIMNRADMVRTMSMTFIEKSYSRINLKHIDILRNEVTQLESDYAAEPA